MNKLHILGAGAIGKLYASALFESVDISLIVRNGCIVSDVLGGISWKFSSPFLAEKPQAKQVDVDALSASDLDKHSVDCLLVCVKAYQVKEAIESVIHALKNNALVILMHNGMGVWQGVSELLSLQQVVQGLSSHGALWLNDEQHLKHTGTGETFIGPLSHNKPSSSVRDIIQLIQSKLPGCTWVENIQEKQWHKLAVNAVINPITGYYQCKNGDVLKPEFSSAIDHICDEVSQVALAEGISISPESLKETVEQVALATAENFSSTNRDTFYGRQTELDFINGYIVSRASKHGISAPENIRLLELFEGSK